MAKTNIPDEVIKSFPLVTNRINVSFDRGAFFSKYAVVSYYSIKKKHNLAYEHLADAPCLSVTGLRALWTDDFFSTRFFVLTDKGKEDEILHSLRKYDDILSVVDDLSGYTDKVVQRIVASLAVNALGKRHIGSSVYNDASLLLCDNANFDVKTSKHELVCLKIEVNAFLNLAAKTQTFSHPKSFAELAKRKNCVFKVCDDSDVSGFLWNGRSVKPVAIDNFSQDSSKLNRDDFFIKKKFSDYSYNLVPYWPLDPKKFNHGRLFAITQVVESVNRLFSPSVQISFAEFPVLHYDEYKTSDAMLELIKEELAGTSLFIEDPFKTVGSKKLTFSLITEFCSIMGETMKIKKKLAPGDMVIKLCEPSTDGDVNYEKALKRLSRNNMVFQHCTYDVSKNDDVASLSKARRLLIELVVKKGLVENTFPCRLAPLVRGWDFTLYKLIEGNLHGATLSLTDDNEIVFKEYGLSGNIFGEDFDSFCREQLRFNDSGLIKGSRNFRAMRKEGNVYLIVDTDEIPILDAKLIDETYGRIIEAEKSKGENKDENKGVNLGIFKRKKEANAHRYLRGYMGFHLWKTEGLRGEPDESFSYIAGFNNSSLNTSRSTKMDRMPRARRIFILHKEDPSKVDGHIMEIASMLKFGFGRWNELMTYPFPFKYLQEYLDNACEISFSTHWNDFNSKTLN